LYDAVGHDLASAAPGDSMAVLPPLGPLGFAPEQPLPSVQAAGYLARGPPKQRPTHAA
jgi:hypothetical protein